ncbi:hypothetical protein [Paenibacillus roseipurpureus]|uniref:Uncharacterized protein n=1 Tax=Paenibacillus roseopurpureus TaxID=2918901 RepID=A0AA96RJ42_9BACL|nr:hypothetical protein [Paenibacillus sp. MBLB1832]WNR44988.1 hypothetical protein MJB10_02210 [Paenibacillus sp. MBLB1832]
MNRVKQVVKLHSRSAKLWVGVPWAILALNFLISFVIALSLSDEESIHTGSLSSIFIYTFVAGTLTLKESFPFAIGFSIRRRDYFFGTILTVLYVNAASAITLTVLSAIEEATNGWNANLHLFKVEFLSDVSFLGMLGINFSLLIHCFFLGFVISSLHRRWGGLAMYLFFGASLVLGTILTYVMTHFNLWVEFGHWIAHYYLDFFWWMIPVSAIYLFIAYGVLRRAAV